MCVYFSIRRCFQCPSLWFRDEINHFSSTSPAWGNYRLQKQVIMAQINSSALPRLRHQHCFGAVLAILAYIYSLHPLHRREPLHSTVILCLHCVYFHLCIRQTHLSNATYSIGLQYACSLGIKPLALALLYQIQERSLNRWCQWDFLSIYINRERKWFI